MNPPPSVETKSPFHRKQKGGGEEEEERIKQTRLRWELSSGAVEGGVYPRLCYPFQMLLAALRGSAHVSALSSVVLPRLLHRSSAAASTSLLTHRHRCCCCSSAGVRDVAGPNNVKSTGGSRRRRVMQRRTNNIRSGAAERRTLTGGETLGGGRGENRARSHRLPPTLLLVPPAPLTHYSSSYPDTLHYTGGGVSPGKGGHSSSINALIQPGSRHRAPAGVSPSLPARRFGL